jgi:peptide/nickel transport system substrate-binding protein
MNKTRLVRSAVAASAAVALLALGVYAPANGATRTTVVLVESNAMTSLNPGTGDTNLTVNVDISYMSNSSFNYYDDHKNLVKNTIFGSYAIVKDTPKDFRVTYTVAPGRVWSDGTPITGVDLLLSHILNSSAYSIKAGLGDPNDSKATPAFNSINYGGTYDNHIVGLPTLSADKMSVTYRYDAQIPDWDLYGPGPNPVHALELLAAGRKSLGVAAENLAAKDKFASDFTSYNTASLKAMAKVWSESYNIKTVDATTNPLLLVGNGGYLVSGAVADQSTTLSLNPRFNSGPATSGLEKIVLKYGVADGSPAAQALANGEIDVYQGQPTADAVTQLKAISGVTVIGGTGAVYEHIDLRVGSGQGQKDAYTGPFSNAGDSNKARDLRTAFLLAYPRDEIVNKLIKPINPNASVINSVFILPDAPGYSDMVTRNGSNKFTGGTQALRTAKALALVKKYYPTASAGSPAVKITLLWGQPSNTRRASEAALVKAAELSAGFDVTTTGTQGWSSHLDENKYDAEFFAWVSSSVTQQGNCDAFKSNGGNNHLGINLPAVDAACKVLEAKLSPSNVRLKWLGAELAINKEAVTLGVFQHPAVTAVNSTLQGVKPAPLSPQLVWNYWQWHF